MWCLHLRNVLMWIMNKWLLEVIPVAFLQYLDIESTVSRGLSYSTVACFNIILISKSRLYQAIRDGIRLTSVKCCQLIIGIIGMLIPSCLQALTVADNPQELSTDATFVDESSISRSVERAMEPQGWQWPSRWLWSTLASAYFPTRVK